MQSDYDENIWSDRVYNRGERAGWVALGVLAGLALGSLIMALVVMFA